MDMRKSRITGADTIPFITSVLGVAAIFIAASISAAPRYVETNRLKVFDLDSKQIAISDGSGFIMDAGFLPPDSMKLYWLQPSLGKPHLYTYDLASGAQKDLSGLLPESALPDALAWAPDGERFAFIAETHLTVVSVLNGSRLNLDLVNGLDPRHLHWTDSSHIIGKCDHTICQYDLDSGKSQVFAWSEPGIGEMDGYSTADKRVLWDTFGPDDGSAVFVANLEGGRVSAAQKIPFPELNGESSISVSADGTYAITDTLFGTPSKARGSAGMPLGLFIGNIKSGKWARLEGSKPWGRNFSAKISSTGDRIAVTVWPDNMTTDDKAHLYIAKLPRALLDYLSEKSPN